MSFVDLHDWDSDNDPDFQSGLASIIDGNASHLAEEEREDLILQAKCFYFSRKLNLDPPIDPNEYRIWLLHQQRPSTVTSDQESAATIPQDTEAPLNAVLNPAVVTAATTPFNSFAPSTSSTQPQPSNHQPTYPPTFSELVDLITQNKPIPGIEEIPDTVIEDPSLLSSEAASPVSARRKKPWEDGPGALGLNLQGQRLQSDTGESHTADVGTPVDAAQHI